MNSRPQQVGRQLAIFAIGLVCLVAGTSAQASDERAAQPVLGAATLLSSLNEPLRAEIELRNAIEFIARSNGANSQSVFRLAPLAIYADRGVVVSDFLERIALNVQLINGQPKLLLSSNIPAQEQTLDVIVELQPSSQDSGAVPQQRHYVLNLPAQRGTERASHRAQSGQTQHALKPTRETRELPKARGVTGRRAGNRAGNIVLKPRASAGTPALPEPTAMPDSATDAASQQAAAEMSSALVATGKTVEIGDESVARVAVIVRSPVYTNTKFNSPIASPQPLKPARHNWGDQVISSWFLKRRGFADMVKHRAYLYGRDLPLPAALPEAVAYPAGTASTRELVVERSFENGSSQKVYSVQRFGVERGSAATPSDPETAERMRGKPTVRVERPVKQPFARPKQALSAKTAVNPSANALAKALPVAANSANAEAAAAAPLLVAAADQPASRTQPKSEQAISEQAVRELRDDNPLGENFLDAELEKLKKETEAALQLPMIIEAREAAKQAQQSPEGSSPAPEASASSTEAEQAEAAAVVAPNAPAAPEPAELDSSAQASEATANEAAGIGNNSSAAEAAAEPVAEPLDSMPESSQIEPAVSAAVESAESQTPTLVPEAEIPAVTESAAEDEIPNAAVVPEPAIQEQPTPEPPKTQAPATEVDPKPELQNELQQELQQVDSITPSEASDTPTSASTSADNQAAAVRAGSAAAELDLELAGQRANFTRPVAGRAVVAASAAGDQDESSSQQQPPESARDLVADVSPSEYSSAAVAQPGASNSAGTRSEELLLAQADIPVAAIDRSSSRFDPELAESLATRLATVLESARQIQQESKPVAERAASVFDPEVGALGYLRDKQYWRNQVESLSKGRWQWSNPVLWIVALLLLMLLLLFQRRLRLQRAAARRPKRRISAFPEGDSDSSKRSQKRSLRRNKAAKNKLAVSKTDDQQPVAGTYTELNAPPPDFAATSYHAGPGNEEWALVGADHLLHEYADDVSLEEQQPQPQEPAAEQLSALDSDNGNELDAEPAELQPETGQDEISLEAEPASDSLLNSAADVAVPSIAEEPPETASTEPTLPVAMAEVSSIAQIAFAVDYGLFDEALGQIRSQLPMASAADRVELQRLEKLALLGSVEDEPALVSPSPSQTVIDPAPVEQDEQPLAKNEEVSEEVSEEASELEDEIAASELGERQAVEVTVEPEPEEAARAVADLSKIDLPEVVVAEAELAKTVEQEDSSAPEVPQALMGDGDGVEAFTSTMLPPDEGGVAAGWAGDWPKPAEPEANDDTAEEQAVEKTAVVEQQAAADAEPEENQQAPEQQTPEEQTPEQQTKDQQDADAAAARKLHDVDALDSISAGDRWGTLLDLAHAYMDMGEVDEARRMLEGVARFGDESYAEEAKQLLAQLS